MIRRDPFRQPEELVRRLYSYVAYTIGDGPDAEDVTSEAFERGLRYRSSYDPGKGTPLTWLIGIARRCIADRAGRVLPLPIAELTDEPGHEDLEARSVVRLSVREAVARLPERDRELVALRYGADLTARQIAELLDLRTNAVEVALHRLHARLRAELDQPVASSEPRKGLDPATGM
ncbi:MAG TPA: sigma-70 family RNA polymerase sigma factor [Gaiellaceae bacterium]|nr:sigma-70 family RNA polymerase sigma factor [Gaiellaceae bacterium]